MGADPTIYIGQQFGIYKITKLLQKKDRHNHYAYEGECQECGFIKRGTLYDFKNKNVQKCTHWSKLTQDQKDAWYEKNKRQCLHCGKDIPLGNKSPNEYNSTSFCNISCSTSYYNKITKTKNTKEFSCLNCGAKLNRDGKYCSHKCQHEYQYNMLVERWKNHEVSGLSGSYQIADYVRKYLFIKYENKCAECGWGEMNPTTGKIPLEVHHIDGNYKNNDESNLTLLCPNCHSLTPTYKAANKGSGRQDRKKYYKQ